MPLNFMKYMLRIVAPLFLFLGLFNSASAQATCTTDWSIAAPIVYREKLVTVEALSRIAADRISGSSIVRTALCEENGAFSYRIVVRDDHGRLSSHTVDARAPFRR
jgi:uncharacterized membrane protein YkoI